MTVHSAGMEDNSIKVDVALASMQCGIASYPHRCRDAVFKA